MGKGKYKVTIEELVTGTFEVEAESLSQAMKIAEEKYRAGKFVLEPGEVIARQMRAEHTDSKTSTQWVEF